MRHMIHKEARCPYYLHEDSQVIYCTGVEEGSVMHIAFASKTNSLAYKKKFCRDKCKSCLIYQMLERIENEG